LLYYRLDLCNLNFILQIHVIFTIINQVIPLVFLMEANVM
jgi:hypothetical protein